MKNLHVEFVKDKKKVAEDMVFFLNGNNYFSEEAQKIIFKDHPELEKRLSKEKIETGSRQQIIENYVADYFLNHETEIEKALKLQELEWRKVEKRVAEFLSSLLKTDWKGLEKITDYIGIMEIYPRDLTSLSFQTGYKQYPFYSQGTILHEITHFIYFKKWQELFPKDSKDFFEAPHPFWHLSEILAPILNNEEALRLLVSDAAILSYDEYTSRPINESDLGLSRQGYFMKKYLEFKLEGKSIEDFLRFSREEIQKIKF